MSVSRQSAACYRLYAVNCLELAEHVADVERRIFLLHMAQDWLKLAVQVERAVPDDDARAPEPGDEPAPDRPLHVTPK